MVDSSEWFPRFLPSRFPSLVPPPSRTSFRFPPLFWLLGSPRCCSDPLWLQLSGHLDDRLLLHLASFKSNPPSHRFGSPRSVVSVRPAEHSSLPRPWLTALLIPLDVPWFRLPVLSFGLRLQNPLSFFFFPIKTLKVLPVSECVQHVGQTRQAKHDRRTLRPVRPSEYTRKRCNSSTGSDSRFRSFCLWFTGSVTGFSCPDEPAG